MTKATQKKLGIILIWIGILAWAPYIYLVTNGRVASIWPYLIVHLGGSFFGGKLYGPAPKDKSLSDARRRKISKVLIYLGVMAWLPYIYLTNVAGLSVSITPYLTIHLVGIFGGILARLSINFGQNKKRKAESRL